MALLPLLAEKERKTDAGRRGGRKGAAQMKRSQSITDELIEAIMALSLDDLNRLYYAIDSVCNLADVEAMKRVDATYQLERRAAWEKRGPDDLRRALSRSADN